MTPEICVDANLAVMWYTPEPLRAKGVALLDECLRLGTRIVAPDWIFAEAGSAIRRKVHRGILELDEGRGALFLLADAQIDCVSALDLFDAAWDIAARHHLPTLYDAYYMALAEARGCDLWTADERLINSARGVPYLRNIAEFAPGALET